MTARRLTVVALAILPSGCVWRRVPAFRSLRRAKTPDECGRQRPTFLFRAHFFARGKIGTAPDAALIKSGNPKNPVLVVYGFYDSDVPSGSTPLNPVTAPRARIPTYLSSARCIRSPKMPPQVQIGRDFAPIALRSSCADSYRVRPGSDDDDVCIRRPSAPKDSMTDCDSTLPVSPFPCAYVQP